MTLTRHGHHIEGTTDADETGPAAIMRCGGLVLCKVCREDAETILDSLIEEEKSNVDKSNPLGLNREEPKLLPIEIMRPVIHNFGAMEFMGGEESAFELIVWLGHNGIQATHWLAADNIHVFENDKRATAERVEFVHSPVRTKQIFVGDWLVHGRRRILNSWKPEHPAEEFEVFTPDEMEIGFERASILAPAMWPVQIPWTDKVPSSSAFQPDLDAIIALKESRKNN